MRKLLVAVIVAVMALTAASSATAAVPITVSLNSCAAEGGEATVPAGSTVVVAYTWSDTTRSLVSRFLRVQQTNATVNGTSVANASSLWGPVTSLNGGWATTWSYDTAVTLGAGESLAVTFDIVLTKRLRTGDGTVYEPGSVFGGPITCRITALA